MNLSNRIRRQVVLWMASSLAAAFCLTVLIQGLLLRHSSSFNGSAHHNSVPIKNPDGAEALSSPVVPVFLSHENRVENVPLETYVRGVVAAEMPIEFELEALKAQALAARTYIVRRMLDKDDSQVPVHGALVTDTVVHQAYLKEDQIGRNWSGAAARENMSKLNRAVEETKDKILLYEGKPINAVFFSTSNGHTENAEDYWGRPVPYLRSVPSPWDAVLSPRYKETIKMPYKEFLGRLGLTGTVSAASAISGARVTEWTEGQYVKKIRIGGRLFTGRDVREKLQLNSARFEWKLKGSDVLITTTGYGHGVGMSQWGADGMAKEGKTAEEIVKYYYKGIEIGKKPDTIK